MSSEGRKNAADLLAAAQPFGLTAATGSVGTRVPVTDMAFGNRAPHLMIEIIALWEPDDPRAAEHRAWAGNLVDALEPEALPGRYPNLLGPDEVAQIAHAYGPNAERVLA